MTLLSEIQAEMERAEAKHKTNIHLNIVDWARVVSKQSGDLMMAAGGVGWITGRSERQVVLRNVTKELIQVAAAAQLALRYLSNGET